VEGAVIVPLALIAIGLISTVMGIVEVRDWRAQKGQFSKRHLVSFGHWKITRHLVAFNSWANLIAMLGFGPILLGIGVWLLLK